MRSPVQLPGLAELREPELEVIDHRGDHRPDQPCEVRVRRLHEVDDLP